MGTYWGADGKTVDGRFEIVAGSVADGQTLWTPGMLYNETTSDKPRGNTQGTLLASAARTAGVFSPNITNYNARGVILTINVTALSGTTPSLVLQMVDNIGVVYVPVSTAMTATGVYKYVLYPAPLTAPANSVGIVQLPLPRIWAIYFNITGTTPSFTFSATYDAIL